jgi:K+-transporting ATPase ATPase A chain
MNSTDFVFVVFTLLILFLASIPIGRIIANIFEKKYKLIESIQSKISTFLGINFDLEMNYKNYAQALILFNILGFLFVFIILVSQQYLPLNPEHLKGLDISLAFNTAISFVTNTNWQAYSGESTLSYFSQMVALTGQNFLSAATGICVLLVLIRAFKNSENTNLGNFWDDLIRSSVYILLPLSILFAIVLVKEGTIQNFHHYVKATTLEGNEQIIPMGPVASQVSIKMLGTNGGGFFNANSAHPFENPTPLTNFLQLISILLLPASLVVAFGELINKRKESLTIYLIMGFLLIGGLSLALWSEYSENPALSILKNYEGKEWRFGITSSVMWSNFTTAASSGSINAAMSSLNPITAMVAIFNMMLGEIIFGGVGSGLYGMILFILLAVFISGLMVGRTPEYLGKKIETNEMKMVVIAILIPNLFMLIGPAITFLNLYALKSLSSGGTHGFTEVLYAVTSGAANNGSAFAGLNANTNFFNYLIGISMLFGRFGVIIPIFYIAKSLTKKKIIPHSNGTLPTDSLLFAGLTIGIILIVGGLTFFPALCLGPIIEQFLMKSSILF